MKDFILGAVITNLMWFLAIYIAIWRKEQYWLFWDHHGYMHFQVFKTEKAARKKITRNMKVYDYPILIKGIELVIQPKKEEKTVITHDDIPVFPYETKEIDGEIWVKLNDALKLKKEESTL